MTIRRISFDAIFWLLVTMTSAVLQDYCLRDTFEAKCHDNEVVVMTSARYGRRRLGKCIRKDFGYLGCGQEVLSQTDRICSGQQQCRVDVFKTFGTLRPCSELESYLEADYDCVPVLDMDQRQCFPTESEPIATEKELISSYWVERAVHPSQTSCTLKLRAKPGQRWNISLVDFDVARTHPVAPSPGVGRGGESPGAEDPDSARLPVCRQYAAVRDERSNAKSVVCGGGAARDKVVHLSTGHLIQVEIFSRKRDSGSSPQFLLRVEAVGCPDLELPYAVVVWRDVDRMQMRCNSTSSDQMHEMVCVNKIWTGDVNCNKERVLSFWQRIQQDWVSRPAYGILLMTLLGVILGIIIGCSLLTISVLCHRRNSRRDSNKNQLSNELQKTLLVRKSLDSLSRNCTQSIDSVAAVDFVMTPMMTSSSAAAARTIWPPPPQTTQGARADDYFVPHKYSLRTPRSTEAGDGRDRRSSPTDFGSTVSASDPVDEDGCRYHPCLVQKTVAAGAETEVGGGGTSSFKAPPGDANAAAAASVVFVQPAYSASSGYGNSSASLNLAEHIYEIPE